MTDNIAWLKHFAIRLLEQAREQRKVVMNRRSCGLNEDDIVQLLCMCARALLRPPVPAS